jgi:hypothetical protein
VYLYGDDGAFQNRSCFVCWSTSSQMISLTPSLYCSSLCFSAALVQLMICILAAAGTSTRRNVRPSSITIPHRRNQGEGIRISRNIARPLSVLPSSSVAPFSSRTLATLYHSKLASRSEPRTSVLPSYLLRHRQYLVIGIRFSSFFGSIAATQKTTDLFVS